MDKKIRDRLAHAINSPMWPDFMLWVKYQQEKIYDDIITCERDELESQRAKAQLLKKIENLRDEINRK